MSGGLVRSDVLTPQQRSRCMSNVKSTRTKPEIALRKALWSTGLRYRVSNKLPGKPDLVFSRAKLAIFVDGCFWHQCPIHRTTPKTNASFWNKKLTDNVERDARVTLALQKEGWTVLRFWEHEVRKDLSECVHRIQDTLRSNLSQ